MIDLFMTWWLFPAWLTLIAFHFSFMLCEKQWHVVYDSETVKETCLLVVLWPLGVCVLMSLVYAMVRSAIAKHLEK